MIKTITQQNFVDYFNTWHDKRYANQFSYDGKLALFNYLEELEEDTNTQMEFDIVAISCDFSEFENLEDVKKEYGNAIWVNNIDDLRDYTQVIEIPNTTRLIIKDF